MAQFTKYFTISAS